MQDGLTEKVGELGVNGADVIGGSGGSAVGKVDGARVAKHGVETWLVGETGALDIRVMGEMRRTNGVSAVNGIEDGGNVGAGGQIEGGDIG